jgi:hypothetical protein
VLEGLSDKIAADYLPLLHRLVDNIALLDMLAGFSLAPGADRGGAAGVGGGAAPCAGVPG